MIVPQAGSNPSEGGAAERAAQSRAGSQSQARGGLSQTSGGEPETRRTEGPEKSQGRADVEAPLAEGLGQEPDPHQGGPEMWAGLRRAGVRGPGERPKGVQGSLNPGTDPQVCQPCKPAARGSLCFRGGSWNPGDREALHHVGLHGRLHRQGYGSDPGEQAPGLGRDPAVVQAVEPEDRDRGERVTVGIAHIRANPLAAALGPPAAPLDRATRPGHLVLQKLVYIVQVPLDGRVFLRHAGVGVVRLSVDT